MVSKKVTVTNKTGIHARPASIFINTASKFKAEITVQNGAKKGNAKKMINMLGLGISAGTEIVITAEGEDEREAVDTLVKLVESKFDEE